ncbi:MAG TPA: FkbM family methyltransferase [Dongiaceae bacterium]|nr:FkbM family methyltransferase [Dongiaceae bacterium]
MSDSQRIVRTIYGSYTEISKSRLDLSYDYEAGTVVAFRRAVEALKIDHLLDVGANIGLYAIYLSDIESIQSIHVFEPSPHAFEVLNGNVAIQQNPSKFVTYDVAASDKQEEKRFHVVSSLAGNNRITSDVEDDKTIPVKSAPIDSLLTFANQRIAIKIDVEGHELQVLYGMKKLLSGNDCFLQVECLNESLATAVRKLLTLLGYKLLFVLRDDYIYVSQGLLGSFDAVQAIYFQSLQKDLAELLELRKEKRVTIATLTNLLVHNGYPYDPVLPPAKT